jgi:hypothetical protein
MKMRILRAQVFIVIGCLLSNACSGKKEVGSGAQSNNAPVASAASPDQKFSADEMDELLAPIALYPDPLLAQMAPAATFIDQLEEAERVLGGKSDDNLIANQNWDVSVKSVAHYPDVLHTMVEKDEWTTALGQAYVSQPADVDTSMQRLRTEAVDAGNLQTTPQQEVITEGQVIRIEPAQPQVIYVPQYDPQVVYEESGPSTGAAVAASVISFGAGLAIGAWLNNDWDYGGRGVYYHGWSGGGWVGANSSYVNVNRSVYVNNSFSQVNVNRAVVSRNNTAYRSNLNRQAAVRSERVNAHSRDLGAAGVGRAGMARPGAGDLNRPGVPNAGGNALRGKAGEGVGRNNGLNAGAGRANNGGGAAARAGNPSRGTPAASRSAGGVQASRAGGGGQASRGGGGAQASRGGGGGQASRGGGQASRGGGAPKGGGGGQAKGGGGGGGRR